MAGRPPAWFAGLGHKLHQAYGLAEPCSFSSMISELQAHFEPTSETEGMEKDTDEMEEDYPPADLPASKAQVAHGWSEPASAAAQEAPPQQHLSFQLSKLRQETSR